jgi:parallel beta-helix repeat protein
MQTASKFTLAGLVLLLLVACSGQAFSATVAVGSCTSLVNFATIQQAVNAVPAGSIVKICPGTYQEQVLITERLTLEGFASAGSDSIVILPPASGLLQNTTDPSGAVAAQILVQDTAGPVLISNLTVDGTGNQISGCSADVRGIVYQNASGTVNHVAARNQVPGDVPSGCQSGQGIFVETDPGMISTVIVENSSVHNYNKNGIVARYAGATLTATANYVRGNGVVASGGAAQNGIEFAYSATGKINNNSIIDNIYGDLTVATSSDILLFDTAENSSITVSGNTVGDSNIPIALETDTANVGDGVTVSGNKVLGGTTLDGIDVCTNGNTIKTNTIADSTQSGLHLDGSCGGTGNNNTISGNTFVEGYCAGILADASTTDTIGAETYTAVPFTVASSTSRCTIPDGSSNDVSKEVTGRAKTLRSSAHLFVP